MKRNLRRWPTLFKKSTSTGKIQTWTIWVEGSTIFTEFGVTGEKLKGSKDTIKAGKNIGRSNETTKEEQAEAEAASKYQKYLDRGFVTDPSGTGGTTSKLLFPMLAHDYSKHGHKLNFPMAIDAKLDGVRATFQNGKFISRGGKPLAALPDLAEEVLKLTDGAFIPDGELYNHDLRHEFEEIISSVKKVKGENLKEHLVQYHIYDLIIPDMSFNKRNLLLKELFRKYKGDSLVKVPRYLISDEGDLQAAHSHFLNSGYEGSMIRDLDSLYEVNKRSYGLLKLKNFDDSEFRIVGIEEGRGALQGAVGKFILLIEDDGPKRTFDCILAGTGRNEWLKKAFKDHSLWKGKWMQVKYMGWTNKERKPRHPVGLKIRDAE